MTDIGLRNQINSGNLQKGEFNTHLQRKAHVNETRRTHFIFGKHPTVHYSQTKFEEMNAAGKKGGRQH